MKKILITSLLVFSSATFAQQNTAVQTESTASNQGNNQSLVFSSPAETSTTINSTTNQVLSGGTNSTVRQEFGEQVIKNTPSVNSPMLTSSSDTCMGSATASANGPGFGVSLGKTYTDANCVMLKNARELWNMGMKAAALALMCKDANNRDALELTGYACPQTARDRQLAQAGTPIYLRSSPVMSAP